MKRTIMVAVILATTLVTGAKPTTGSFEGPQPVFVKVCIPNGPCTGFYVDKDQAKKMRIPHCTATVTNFCWQ